MTFEQPTEGAGSEVNIPDPLVNVLEADICSAAELCDSDPLMVPTAATMGADVAHLEAVRVRERWPCVGPLPEGGGIAGGGCAPVERLVRPLAVERRAEARTRALLSPPSAGWRAGGVRLQRALQAVMAAVRLGCAGRDARGEEPQAAPPGGAW
jgi:hypothetical protein